MLIYDIELPVRVLLTTLAGDTPWNAKLLRAVGATATNACPDCYVPTLQVQDNEGGKSRQRYTSYRDGFELTEEMVNAINKTKTVVS